MSTDLPADPHPTSPIEAKLADKSIDRIRYLYSYSAVFENPNWFMNLLLSGVCLLIPAVGQIVVLGYEYEMIETLHRRKGAAYPDFDFNRFVPYLTRGIWPWLISLILNIVIQFPLQVGIHVAMFGIVIAVASEESAGIITAAVVIPLMLIAMMFFGVLMTMLTVPMLLRAGLSQEIGQAFRFDWIRDFTRRVWLEEILVICFLSITGSILMFVGMAFFCIGMIPAMMLWELASCFMFYQLYELYLARGGEPIPLKEEPKPLPPIRSDIVYPEVLPEAES